ncbi:MAG: hypothetical protein B7Y90_18260 [Alphaproteobacteria bacterium 32-64-14]|nr:MAG: hypothetical protein B7Y90_18260 [Alphaproteobacteria bacterium 32-64-14]
MKRTALALALLATATMAGCETAGELLVSSTMSGDWTGTAYCAYGVPIEMVLTLGYLPGGATTATNKIAFKGDVGEAVIASYTLRGTYDAATYKLSLQPEGWIGGMAATKPGAVMLPIETQLEPSSRTMKVQASSGCSPFELSKQPG